MENEAEDYLKRKGVDVSKWPRNVPAHSSEKVATTIKFVEQSIFAAQLANKDISIPKVPKATANDVAKAERTQKEAEAEAYLKKKGIKISQSATAIPKDASEEIANAIKLLNNKYHREWKASKRARALQEKSANFP